MRSLPYINSPCIDHVLSPPGLGNVSPDRPRSAVPAARILPTIAVIMVETLTLILILIFNGAAATIQEKKANTISKQAPMNGLISQNLCFLLLDSD